MIRTISVLGWVILASSVAAQSASPAAAFMKLLKSGRIPKERQGNIVKLICQRGNAEDLGYIYQQCIKPDAFTAAVRLQALQGLAEATLNRKVIPTGDLSGLGSLVQGKNPAEQKRAIQLAGMWKVRSVSPVLHQLALAKKTNPGLRQAALDALVGIDKEQALAAIDKLTAANLPPSLRYLGAAALTKINPPRAAQLTAGIMAKQTDATDPATAITAFLDLKGGADLLAGAVSKEKVPPDVAKLALRFMYSIGRSDASLVQALSKAAGIDVNARPPSKAKIDELAGEVMTKGNARRGEQVFRRADLNCFKCHALNGAGGPVGPDLRDVGTNSPPDYLVRSILLPSESIKEEFLTLQVFTSDGKIYHGIVVDDGDQALVLKDATGQVRKVPKNNIEERLKGKSLMPSGLANFITRNELIDLVRFLSELGKPGDYGLRLEPTIRRWRYLKPVPEDLVDAVPDEEVFFEKVLGADESHWHPAYAMISGELPLAELTKRTGRKVLYVQGEIEVKSPGKVGLQVGATDGLHFWIDEKPVAAGKKIVTELPAGRHKVTIRVDSSRLKALRVDLVKVEGSPAAAEVVGGP